MPSATAGVTGCTPIGDTAYKRVVRILILDYKRSVVENRNVAVYEATAISLGASGNMHVVMPYMWTGSSKTGQVYREQHSIERCPCGNKCRQRHPDALTTPD